MAEKHSVFIRKPFAIKTHLVITQHMRGRLDSSRFDLEGPWREDSPLSCVNRSDSGPSLTPEQPFLQQPSTDHSSKPAEQPSQCLLTPLQPVRSHLYNITWMVHLSSNNTAVTSAAISQCDLHIITQ